jgi:hypothetical protein
MPVDLSMACPSLNVTQLQFFEGLTVFTYNDNISTTRYLHCWRLFTHYIAALYVPQPSVIGTASQTDWADLQNKLLFSFSFMVYLMTLSVFQTTQH